MNDSFNLPPLEYNDICQIFSEWRSDVDTGVNKDLMEIVKIFRTKLQDRVLINAWEGKYDINPWYKFAKRVNCKTIVVGIQYKTEKSYYDVLNGLRQLFQNQYPMAGVWVDYGSHPNSTYDYIIQIAVREDGGKYASTRY